MFKQWCASQHFNNTTNLSHVLMDGGSLSVPSDRLIDFYEKCVECIRLGEPIFVVEQKTEVYNFFLDLDYKDKDPWSLDTIKIVSKVICDKVETFGGRECLVSIAKPKSVGHGAEQKTKTGVHMNWPGFPVNQVGALRLRSHIISILVKMYPGVKWEQVVDKAVYGTLGKSAKGSGFRMPWSHKRGKHGACDGKGCTECGRGKITESPYLPVFLFKDQTLEPVDFTEPCVSTLVTATVRSIEETPTEIEATAEPEEEPPDTKPRKNSRETCVNSTELDARLKTFIRNNLPGQKDCDVTKILKHDKSFSCGSTSRFCSNVNREHNSNHVWFSIYEGRVTQRCFDEECKQYSSREYMLGPSILKLLYPDRNVLSFVGSGAPRTVQGAKASGRLSKKIQN